MTVIVAHEKHGTFIYKSALVLLERRIADGFWYDNWDDGDPYHQWEDRADQVLALSDEAAAWRFLRSREDHEHEYVERQRVIDA